MLRAPDLQNELNFERGTIPQFRISSRKIFGSDGVG